MRLIGEAVVAGARVKNACQTLEISFRSYLRWKAGKLEDGRKGAAKTVPRKLSDEEREAFYKEANTARFRDMTPDQIVAILCEEGTYYGSERTLYRIFTDKKALASRTESRKPGPSRKPPELVASGPNQVWSWDITWLRTDIKGFFNYAYVVIDVFSRAIVGWSVEDCESPDHAQKLFERIILKSGVRPQFVHADNGGPMRGVSLVAFLTDLQVGLTHSRPRVSDDNPYIESFFRTVKYHVSFPSNFATIQAARDWFALFIDWYNTQHRHSGIGYATPTQKHYGQDIKLLESRQETLNTAARTYPERFVRGPKTVAQPRLVYLNKKAS
ncbi:MAG: IS3 family transposase [Terriglobia bacterium]